MGSSRATLAAGAVGLVLLAGPGAGGEFNPLGDGSHYDNPDLLRDRSSGCENCLAAPPYEWGDAPFDLDWSLGLRGAITQGGSGTTYETIALPKLTLTHDGMRGSYAIGGEAELAYSPDAGARVDGLRLSAGGGYRFDAVTELTASGSFSLSQDDPDAGGYPVNVATTPLELSGAAEAGVRRTFGVFDVALRGNVARETFGTTVLDDASSIDNSHRNLSGIGAGGRLGYALTPGLTAFTDVEAVHQAYDAASPSLMAKLDNVTYAGRAGLGFRLDETLELEGSLGLAYRDFGDPAVLDFAAVLYDASVVLRPDETLALTASFATTVSSPGGESGAAGKIAYEASVEAGYRVNPWLRLRGSAGWSEAHFTGIDNDEYRWKLGAGADYLLNEHTDIAADYDFSRTQTTPDPPDERHRLSLGLTFHR